VNRVRELEVQNLKVVENNEFLSEKLNQLESESDQVK